MACSEGVIGEGWVKGLFAKEQRWSEKQTSDGPTAEQETGQGRMCPRHPTAWGARGKSGYQSQKRAQL